jgi:hypothetical protein
MFASSMRERLARAGLKVTEQGVKAARHEGKAGLIVDITKNLAKLKAPDLLVISIIVADLRLSPDK